ncbi:tRNA cyclic N6-threonylcarbamoyladenosine(37) synthase TcdA [Alkalimarinus coralli]|uniref:tRNA cyclic N6-threonylcarbamoyladenosine(37) synthase TcdA n=1 Tax=Alkalimarinus coralli TaxID=2935863 RepID=UPI00202B027B|nr:tRNA cyclic N6-threonylcarbamoyladenosine(37) synthase TcdA [Alkalimarinus coralli]
MSDDFSHRFGGTQRLYGLDAVEKLRQAHVGVIGIGGVGSWAAEALARSAIGKITLFDMDDICVSNVNRQIHALDGEIGRLKVDAMADRIRAINPTVECQAVMSFVTEKNLHTLLDNQFDYIIEATDSVKAKAAIIAYCKRNKIRIVSSGGAGGQIDPSQIQIADLSRTIQDPLLAKVRNLLRRNYNFSRNAKRKFGVECVYSTEQLVYPGDEGQVCHQKPSSDGPVKLDCATGFGASTCVTATFGLFAASRVLNKLAKS